MCAIYDRVRVIAATLGIWVAVALGAKIAANMWQRTIADLLSDLHARCSANAAPFAESELGGLPAPVRRYFAYALTPGQAVVTSARVSQAGEFALRAGAWSPFTADEYFVTEPPGFLWDARVAVAAKIRVFVRDSYVDGAAALHAAIAGITTVANVRGTPTLAAAELLRYLAETPLLPTALLPRNGIAWTAIDVDRARVCLVDGSTSVSCVVTFGGRGEIAEISALRTRDAKDSALTPWIVRFRDERRIAGMMIPTYAEVEWTLPTGPFAYFRGRIVDTTFEFASPD